MKSNILKTALALLTIVFVSCKNDSKTVPTPEKEEPLNSLIVVMNVIVQEDDDFQIYWTEDGSDNFQGDKFVNVDVKGKPEPQEITFVLPEDVFPRQLRFDIGSNKNQKTVKIEGFKLKYLDKTFEAEGTNFWFYFGNNTSIEYSRENATATPLPNNPAGYDPILGGTSNLTKELDKLMKP